MLPIALTSLIVSLSTLLSFDGPYRPFSPPPPHLNFELRHLHALSLYGHVIFSDVSSRTLDTQINGQDDNNSYTVRTRSTSSFTPPSFAAFSRARSRSIKFGQSERLQWDEEEIIGPDIESRETLLELAKMTNNAYVEPDDPDWYDLGGSWNNVRRCPPRLSFGPQNQEF